VLEDIIAYSLMYKSVAVGGTFDRLHDGHKALLKKAVDISNGLVVIGLTGKTMTNLFLFYKGEIMLKNKKYAEIIHPYEKRKQIVLEYLRYKITIYP
jgi:pantetheine-phosphate adenylyltransferase